MTGHQSLQFVEYLRQAGHLKAADAVGVTDTGAPDQLQGNIRRTLQSAALGKLWEATDLSASEFADEVARFYRYDRVALQDMLSATPLVAAFSQRFLRETLVFPYQEADHGIGNVEFSGVRREFVGADPRAHQGKSQVADHLR